MEATTIEDNSTEDNAKITVSTINESDQAAENLTANETKSSVDVISFTTSNGDISIISDIRKEDEDIETIDQHLETPKLSKTVIISNGGGDGSDSGIDFEATQASAGALKRALSSNSGGYASSCGGLDEVQGNASCNSSMISFCSDVCDIKSVNTILRHNSQHDCTSEGGSESSSITGGPICIRKTSVIRKKVALTEPFSPKSQAKRDDNSVAKSRSRAASASRAAAHIKSPPTLSTRDRARSRDKLGSSPIARPLVPQSRSTPIKRPTKPDSLPTGIRDPASPAVHKTVRNRTPSVPRGRTPGCTPTVEDGRWPSMNAKNNAATPKTSRGGSATPENLVIKTKVGPIVLEKQISLDKYATLPRRRKEKSDDDLRSQHYRSSSVQRDRMTSSMIKRQSSTTKDTIGTPCSQKAAGSILSHTNSLSRKKPAHKIKIYQESCVQTALTSVDIENAFAGLATKEINVEAIEKCDQGCQVDIRDKEIEKLQEKIRQMDSEYKTLEGTCAERSQTLLVTEQQLTREKEEKQAMAKELQSNTERVLGMLALVHAAPAKDEENCDSLLMLESQIQQSGHALVEKQCEIEKLYSFCKKLQQEMHRSILVQRSLLVEKEEFEKESTELQDFLQDEKTALVDALKEAETECERSNNILVQKDVDIERLQEECRHLVRISEQRR